MVNTIEVSRFSLRLEVDWGQNNLTDRSQRNGKRQLLEPVEVAMSKPTLEMWDVVLKTYRDVLDQAEESYLIKAKGESLSISCVCPCL